MRDLDTLAAQKTQSREETLAEIIEDYLRNPVRRAQTVEQMERKRRTPGWKQAIEDIEKIRAKVKSTREEELCADMDAAVKAVGMGTLPGVKLYRTLGFVGHESVFYDLGDGMTIEFVPMRKELPSHDD